jgi:hypothetical protein
LAGSAWAGPIVLGFDDIQTNGGVVNMPSGYGGFQWPNTVGVWIGQGSYPAESVPNVVLFNNNGNYGYLETDIFTTSGTVVFDGAYFSGPASGGPIYFNLYDNGVKVWTSAQLTPDPNTPQYLASGYTGAVNEIGIVGNDGYFVMDNFTFQQSGGTTPEPGSIALFGTGLVAIAGMARRKLKR